MTALSARGLKWRRAIAAASALSLFSTAFGWFTASDEGPWAAVVFGGPALLVGCVAAWWAWRGYAVRPTPPWVAAALGALLGGALVFGLGFGLMLLVGGTRNNTLAGLPGALAAPLGALAGALTGWVRQRAVVRAAAAPAAAGRPPGG
jgi:hypothetical protein